MTPRVEVRETPTLDLYSDADFASDKKDRKSPTVNIVLLNGMPVSWSSKKNRAASPCQL